MKYILPALWLCLMFTPAFAQTALERAADQAAEIQRQQAAERARADDIRAPSGIRPERPGFVAPREGERCIDVQTIQVEGVRLIRRTRIARAVAPFEGKCLGLSAINSVLEAITFTYVDKGYITSRAFLPPQDLSDGTLDVIVIEGMLENILMNGDPNALRGQRITAFPGMIGNALNLRDIEQGLEQMGRLRSVEATMEIGAGSEQGGSILIVRRQVARPWSVSLSFDNLGSPSTGQYQSRVNLGYDDLFGLNDYITVSYQRSMENTPWNFFSDPPSGNTFTASLEIPFGYWTLGINGSSNNYTSEISGVLGPIETSGNSRTAELFLSRVLHRNQISKTTLKGTLTWKDTENFILGSLIDVSSRSLSVANLEFSHARQLWGGQATASLGYHQGLDILNAFDDSTAPVGSPKGQFQKIDMSLGYTRPFAIAGQRLIYDGRLQGQWSDDLLFGSEQISLGGPFSIRGVDTSVLFGNRGAQVRNELSLPLPTFTSAWLAKTFGALEPYAAFDVGWVEDQPAFGITGGTLSGATLGLRSRGGRINLDIRYADLIHVPDDFSDIKDRPGEFYATLSIAF